MAKILVADDNPEVLSVLRRALEIQGHEVLTVEDGRSALTLLDDEPVDLLITDLNMPELDGIELLLAVRENSPALPIVVVSGGGLLDKELLLDNAGALGAHRTLAKPLDLRALQQVVAQLLATHGRVHR